MFDPDRDDLHQARPYYVRLVVTVVVTLAVAASLWPSITGFGGGLDHQQPCIAIVNGWRSAPPDPGPFGSPAAQDAFNTWSDGPGLCHDAARHRLFASAIMLTVVLSVSLGVLIVMRRRRTQTNLRQLPTAGVVQ